MLYRIIDFSCIVDMMICWLIVLQGMLLLLLEI